MLGIFFAGLVVILVFSLRRSGDQQWWRLGVRIAGGRRSVSSFQVTGGLTRRCRLRNSVLRGGLWQLLDGWCLGWIVCTGQTSGRSRGAANPWTGVRTSRGAPRGTVPGYRPGGVRSSASGGCSTSGRLCHWLYLISRAVCRAFDKYRLVGALASVSSGTRGRGTYTSFVVGDGNFDAGFAGW